MIIEQLIFTFISFAIFVYMFFRMIKNNDTTYLTVIVLETIGIALNFVEVLFSIKLNMICLILKYLLSILLPILIVIIEKHYASLYELINLFKAKTNIIFGNIKKEKIYLLKVLDRNPNSYKAHLLLANIYEQEHETQKAIDEYVQAIDVNKQDYDSYYKVSELLNKLERKKEASEMLSNLLNKKPDMSKASELLGSILIDQEKYKEAVNVYTEAIRYNPINFELHYNLGIVYTMLNDFQSAKQEYEKAAEINSLSYNSKYSLAQIALIFKELEEAERRFLEVIEDEELSADAYYELARIALIKMDKDTAIRYINTAIDINSKKIVNKVKEDPIFIPIMAKITIPINLEGEDKTKLNKKEIKAKKHLEETCEITRSLSYNDITLLKNDVKKDKKNIKMQEEKQKENKYRE